jgi:hypothetical protein
MANMLVEQLPTQMASDDDVSAMMDMQENLSGRRKERWEYGRYVFQNL